MIVHIIETATAIEVHLQHWTDIVSTAQAERIAQTFETVISQVTGSPFMPLGSVQTMFAQDRARIDNWNLPLPARLDQRVEAMVKDQMKAQPEAFALLSTEVSLTYQELDMASTVLAEQYIPALRPDDIVPLCFNQSIWCVVAVLAVLKAGGVIVLLDRHNQPPDPVY